jgi:hypothetical protein
MDKNGVWSTKHVRAENSSRSLGVNMPRIQMTDPFRGMHSILARGAVQQLILNQLEDGGSLHPVNGRDFGEECLDRFMSFSDDTLSLIASYGVNAEYAEDAVFEYSCMHLLVSARAEEADFMNTLAMSEFLSMEHEVLEPYESVVLCLPLKLYDKNIVQHTGADESTLADRTPYYRALVGTTIALENALNSPHDEDATDDYWEDGDDDSTPPILYCDIAPDQRNLPSSPVIEDQKIIDLVIRNLDRNDEINDFIKERRVTDPDVINEYLTAHPSAVANGSL